MKKEERLRTLESKINDIIDELWQIIPETPRPNDMYIINTQDRVTHNLMTAAAYVRDLINRYDPPKKEVKPKPKHATAIKKFDEIDASKVARKVGWEMEACYELLRAAESSEGQMVLVSNDGMFSDGIETFEVGITMHATGDFKNHEGLTREEADKIFEGYL